MTDDDTADPFRALAQLRQTLRAGVALVEDHRMVARSLNAFWLAMEAQARSRAPFGTPLTLDAFARSVIAGPLPASAVDAITAGGVLASLDSRPLFDSSAALGLQVRSHLAP